MNQNCAEKNAIRRQDISVNLCGANLSWAKQVLNRYVMSRVFLSEERLYVQQNYGGLCL